MPHSHQERIREQNSFPLGGDGVSIRNENFPFEMDIFVSQGKRIHSRKCLEFCTLFSVTLNGGFTARRIDQEDFTGKEKDLWSMGDMLVSG